MPMIDQAPAGAWPNTSTVVTKDATCPAPQQATLVVIVERVGIESYGKH